jgi:hypothetical protein
MNDYERTPNSKMVKQKPVGDKNGITLGRKRKAIDKPEDNPRCKSRRKSKSEDEDEDMDEDEDDEDEELIGSCVCVGFLQYLIPSI